MLKVDLQFNDEVNFDIITRFFIRYAGSAPSNADLDTFCGAVGTSWDAHLKSLTTANIALQNTFAIDLTSSTAAAGSAAGPVNGTRGGDPVSIGTAVVVSYEIARRYRGGHPRGYFPEGASLDLGTLQTWSDAFVAEAQGKHDSFYADITDAGWGGAGTLDAVNISYFAGFTVVTNPTTGRARNVPTLRGAPVVDAVTARLVRNKVGTQRRRLQYG